VRNQIFARYHRADISLDKAGINHELLGSERMVFVLCETCLSRSEERIPLCESTRSDSVVGGLMTSLEWSMTQENLEITIDLS